MNGNGQGPPFYGKFRGVVTDNLDPLMQGRIRAKVSDVLGDEECGWAMPSVPYAGSGVGLFLIPPKEASVWIEFEHGDPDYPIWSGCFWAVGEVPASPPIPDMKVLKTDSATITIDDLLMEVTIETTTGAKIVLNALGIEIDNGQGGKITLTGPQISVNEGALEII